MSDSLEIFRLRKEGELAKALILARACLQQDPNNPWNKKAAAWVFYDHIKQALQIKDFQQAQVFLDKFEALQISDNEKIIYDQINRLRVQLLTQAETVGKPKDPNGLIIYYQNLVDQFPNNTETIGWEIYKELKNLDEASQLSADVTLSFLRLYAKLNVEKPSLLHSKILSLAIKFIDNPAKLINFIKWWDLINLREDDFEKHIYQQRTYPSLSEKVATALSRSIKNQNKTEDCEWALNFLNQVITKYPDNLWLSYHKGKLLVLDGRPKEARKLAIPVVRLKLIEPWAWELLASTYPDNREKNIACLCRALQLNKDEKFITKIRLKLAAHLAEEGEYSAAISEVENVRHVYEAQNWKHPAELTELLNASWYADIETVTDNMDLYQRYAPNAQAIVMEDLPWIEGVLTGEQSGRDGKLGRSFIGYLDDDIIATIPVKHKRFKWLKSLEIGTPLRFKMSENAGQRAVLIIEKREAEVWDLIPTQIGILDHINPHKKLSHILISLDKDLIVYHNRFPEVSEWPEGTFVKLRLHQRPNNRPNLLSITKTDELPNPKIYKPFRGKLKMVRNFGFVSDEISKEDVFISPTLILQYNLVDGELINGGAIYGEKPKLGWKAISFR